MATESALGRPNHGLRFIHVPISFVLCFFTILLKERLLLFTIMEPNSQVYDLYGRIVRSKMSSAESYRLALFFFTALVVSRGASSLLLAYVHQLTAAIANPIVFILRVLVSSNNTIMLQLAV